MWIELLGLLCIGWTTLEVARLAARGVRVRRRVKSSPRSFGAWDRQGQAIDVDLVD